MDLENLIQHNKQKYNIAIYKGVANQLRRWPENFFNSFVVLVPIILFFFFFITALFVSSSYNRSEPKISENERPFNVYFVKKAAQIWSMSEFCYIEAAARKQPELNIYLINLMRTSDASNILDDHLKMALATQNANIRITDLPINEFFSNIAKNLSSGLLLMAARAYLLWESPGITMHPRGYCNLSNITKSWNKDGKRNYTPNKSIIIDPKIDLQATEVPCQAFIGFLLQEILKNVTEIYNLKDALDKFCPRINNCPEVQVLDLKSQCSINAIFDCPTVYTMRNSWKNIRYN